MKILLDAHIFLWLISLDKQIPTDMQVIIQDLDNQDLDKKNYLSIVSTWKAIVKYQLGKLPLPELPEIYFLKHCDWHQILNLDLDLSSVAQLAKILNLHRDLFDKMLIC